MTAYATFGLAPATRAGAFLADGAYEVHREFLDFVVDGRPLLVRLADVDGVSPLAADLGPTVFTSQVRALLLEGLPPLPGGRHVIYACPECEGLECGVVTAVIERDGADVVWRDFVWQTAPAPDPVRDGYRGVGPFRFRSAEYRAVLERLLADGARGARRVLLVGPRVALFARLAAALRSIGIGAEITRDAAGAHTEEIRTYGAVAFERDVGEGERSAVRAAFAAVGSDAVFIEAPAPAVPLLVAQVEQALQRAPHALRRLTALTAGAGRVHVGVAAACRVRLTGYRQDRFRRTRTVEVFEGRLEPGEHTVPLDARLRAGAFVVARTTGDVLVTRLTS